MRLTCRLSSLKLLDECWIEPFKSMVQKGCAKINCSLRCMLSRGLSALQMDLMKCICCRIPTEFVLIFRQLGRNEVKKAQKAWEHNEAMKGVRSALEMGKSLTPETDADPQKQTGPFDTFSGPMSELVKSRAKKPLMHG